MCIRDSSTSPTTLVFPVEDLGGLQLQGKALHGLLSSSPFFLKAPLRGEGCAARCLLAECLWSSCRQAGRTSWSRTLQAGCGVHPLPGGRQQLAQGARRTGGRLRLTAYQHQQTTLHIVRNLYFQRGSLRLTGSLSVRAEGLLKVKVRDSVDARAY